MTVICVQLASYLVRGPLVWKMLLHVNQNPIMMMITNVPMGNDSIKRVNGKKTTKCEVKQSK